MGHRGSLRGEPPPWENAGAELVSEVEPYEQMKLRLLNGAHSSLAYLGYLAGYETVSDVMADADFTRFVRGLMEEATPTLHVPPSTDLAAYKAALIQRFNNPAHPAGDTEREAIERRARFQAVADGAEEPLRQFLAAVHGDLPGAVFQRRVAEALRAAPLVSGEIGRRRHGEASASPPPSSHAQSARNPASAIASETVS